MEWWSVREPFNAWSHAAWMLLAPPATLLLWHCSRGDRLKQLGLVVFGLCLTFCFAGSALYHGIRGPEEDIEWYAAVDAIGVHLLIAGTITPVALVLLSGRWRLGVLTLAWGLAALGIGLRLGAVPLSRAVSTSIYLGMGWGMLTCYAELVRVLSHRAVRPALVGGVLYSVGAVLNHLHWPVLWPGVFSAHEVWHLFVMGGSLGHFWLMLTVVVPFERPAGGQAAVAAEASGDRSARRGLGTWPMK
jgi:hemolysin III